jgi:RNA polymerase sigma-54 factor
LAIHQKLGLSVKLSHRLILTPSLQQAIKLLPLTTLELAEVLDQEVMENPLLEEVPVQETLSTEEIAQQEAKEEAEKPADDDPLKDIDVDKFFEEYFDDGRRGKRTEVPEVKGTREIPREAASVRASRSGVAAADWTVRSTPRRWPSHRRHPRPWRR